MKQHSDGQPKYLQQNATKSHNLTKVSPYSVSFRCYPAGKAEGYVIWLVHAEVALRLTLWCGIFPYG